MCLKLKESCQKLKGLDGDRLTVLGFTTTYKTAGTAKVRGRHTRHAILWVGLWVENAKNDGSMLEGTLIAKRTMTLLEVLLFPDDSSPIC